MPLATQELFRHQFKKTMLCSFYTEGRCCKGNECRFAHDSAQVEAPPDLTKTSLCALWQRGQCCYTAASCKFAHGKHELRMTPEFVRSRDDKRQADKEKKKVSEKAKAKAKVKRPKNNCQMEAVASPVDWFDMQMADPLSLPRAQTVSQVGMDRGPPFLSAERGIATVSMTLSALTERDTHGLNEPMKVIVNKTFYDDLQLLYSIPIPTGLTRKPTFEWEGDSTTVGANSDDRSSRSQSPSLEINARKVQASSAIKDNCFKLPTYARMSELPWDRADTLPLERDSKFEF